MLLPFSVGAEWYSAIGRSISTVSSGPIMPTDLKECLVYSEESDEKYKEIDRAHEECLSSSGATDVRIYKSNGTLIKGKCSKTKCQELHDARDSFYDLKTANVRECYADVSEYKKNHNKKIVYKVKIDNDLARDAIQEHLKNKKGVTTLTAIDMAEFEKGCSKADTAIKRDQCIDAVHQYAADMRKMSHSNSVIRKIQDTSAEKINRIQKNTLNQGISTLESTNKSSTDCSALNDTDLIDINSTNKNEMDKLIDHCK